MGCFVRPKKFQGGRRSNPTVPASRFSVGRVRDRVVRLAVAANLLSRDLRQHKLGSSVDFAVDFVVGHHDCLGTRFHAGRERRDERAQQLTLPYVRGRAIVPALRDRVRCVVLHEGCNCLLGSKRFVGCETCDRSPAQLCCEVSVLQAI